MSLKNFSGTVTIDGVVHNLSGVLEKRGLVIQGTLTFTADTDRFMPVDYRISGSTFTNPSSLIFIDPDGKVVEQTPLDPATTTLGANFSSLDIVNAAINLDGLPALLSMDVDEVISEDEDGIVDEGLAVDLVSLREQYKLRINEVANTYDNIGSTLSVDRRPGESNSSYLNRIRQSISHPSNSSRLGALYGLLRAVNTQRVPSLRVSLKSGLEGRTDAPRLIINFKSIKIYSQWVPLADQDLGLTPTIEQEHVLEGMTIAELVDWINLSDYYEATLLDSGEYGSKFLLPTDTIALTAKELTPQDRIPLGDTNLVVGSLALSESDYLQEEIEHGQPLSSRGEYSVDYENGYLEIYEPPKTPIQVSYLVARELVNIDYTPIRLVDYSEESGQELLFNQIEKDIYSNEEEKYVNGIPTEEGYKTIRKILELKEFPQRWGE